MNLYINAQDIARIAIANLKDATSLSVKEVGPEGFLHAIVTFLKEEM
jgi:hypothetical protein